jgi:hypothetical protein
LLPHPPSGLTARGRRSSCAHSTPSQTLQSTSSYPVAVKPTTLLARATTPSLSMTVFEGSLATRLLACAEWSRPDGAASGMTVAGRRKHFVQGERCSGGAQLAAAHSRPGPSASVRALWIPMTWPPAAIGGTGVSTFAARRLPNPVAEHNVSLDRRRCRPHLRRRPRMLQGRPHRCCGHRRRNQ